MCRKFSFLPEVPDTIQKACDGHELIGDRLDLNPIAVLPK